MQQFPDNTFFVPFLINVAHCASILSHLNAAIQKLKYCYKYYWVLLEHQKPTVCAVLYKEKVNKTVTIQCRQEG